MPPYWKCSAKFSDSRSPVAAVCGAASCHAVYYASQGRQRTCQMQVYSLPMPDMDPDESEGHPEPAPRTTTDSVWCL